MIKKTLLSSPIWSDQDNTLTAAVALSQSTSHRTDRIIILQRWVNPEADILFTRHSISPYVHYQWIFSSDNPSAPFDPNEQTWENGEVQRDVTPEWITFAQKKAEELFVDLNPEQDDLFFVASNEARAISTAEIYTLEAKKRGFVILQPQKTHTVSEGFGNPDIRIMNELWLNFESPLLHSVFNPTGSKVVDSINFSALSPEIKTKYEQARRIILDDDKWSFWENFFYHGAQVKAIFPEIETAQEMHEYKFLKLVEIAQRFTRKLSSSASWKNVRILAFGHENYVSHALHEATGMHSIGNCETVSIKL